MSDADIRAVPSPFHARLALLGLERQVLTLCLSVLIAGCSSAPIGERGPPSWTPGQYRVTGMISYRADSEMGSGSETLELWGDVTVAAEGPVAITASVGLCRDPDPPVLRRELAQGSRSFVCGDVTYTLRPSSNGVRGTISARVTERRRIRTGCRQYQTNASGQRVCVLQGYDVRINRTVKRVSLRAVRLG